jgi:hypothetical protein
MLKVEGERLLDRAGRQIRLRGFCCGGWMNMENFINGYPGQESSFRSAVEAVLGAGKARFFFSRMLDHAMAEDDIEFMAGLGTTALRIPFNYRHFESDAKPFEYRADALKRLDSIIDACGKKGIYAILDLHAAQGWQNPDWHSDNPGDSALLWTHRQFQERVAGLWGFLASHYRSNPAVAGYNVLNEPVCRVRGALPAVYGRIIEAIRRVDRNHIVFLEGNMFSTDFSELSPRLDGNAVFSSHNYSAPGFTDLPYPGGKGRNRWDRGRLLADDTARTEFMRRHRLPAWVGEFGAVYRGTSRDDSRTLLVDDSISVYEELGAHWTIWTYKDIGMMGTAFVRPDSEWMHRTRKVRALKDRLGCDTWGARDSVCRRTIAGLLRGVRTSAGRAVDMGRLEWNANRQLSGILVSGALAEPFAEQFRGMNEKAIDRMMQSWAFRNCAVREPLARVIAKYCL